MIFGSVGWWVGGRWLVGWWVSGRWSVSRWSVGKWSVDLIKPLEPIALFGLRQLIRDSMSAGVAVERKIVS